MIEELFEKLSGTDENSESILEEYTDYRAYMDYDIKITNRTGSIYTTQRSVWKKERRRNADAVLYTVAASFIQLYKNSMSEGCNRTGAV